MLNKKTNLEIKKFFIYTIIFELYNNWKMVNVFSCFRNKCEALKIEFYRNEKNLYNKKTITRKIVTL